MTNKRRLLRFAKLTTKEPLRSDTPNYTIPIPLAKTLIVATNPKHRSYDAKFDKAIRKYRPDWISNLNQGKQFPKVKGKK